MGTSTSSAGAGAGAAFDPPWLDAAEDGIDGSHDDAPLEAPSLLPLDANENDEVTADESAGNGADGQTAPPPVPDSVAPPRRYADARRQLTRFVRTGDKSDLKKALSSFVNKGLGGSARAASRLRVSSAAAAAIGGFLSAVRDGTDANINAWVASARNRGLSANDAALEVVQQLVPTGGSVDEESAKHAMSQAIAHLYELDPAADIFALTDDQIASVMTYTIAIEVYNRVQLELGRVFEKLKYSARLIHERLAQVLDYLVVVVQGGMTKARSTGSTQSARNIATAALHSALEVFGSP